VILRQEKLDVTTKKRSNIFNWRGQFTPEFVEYILQTFAKEGDFVCDPFSGSGTVLLEASRQNLQATGFEINPAAYAMSKFFTFCNLTSSERMSYCNNFETKIHSYVSKLNGQPIFTENEDYRKSYAHLLKFSSEFNENLKDKQERILLLNILFQSEKDKNLTLKTSILKSFEYIKKSLLDLPFTNQPINAILNDARITGGELKNKVDLIVTSPPYINVFNYHQNHRAIIEEFKFDILKVAQSEFGSNRKNRGNRFKTVIQYCIDMELAIRAFWASLKSNGKMVLVLGRESNVRNTAFYNGQLIVEILEESKGFQDIEILERKFTNKFGVNIKEDIIVAFKSNNPLAESYIGRDIALKHLEKNLKNTTGEILSDILGAIKNNHQVLSSPLFNPKNVILK
jgi:DNA modification methylase